jgi:hypothetical protein
MDANMHKNGMMMIMPVREPITRYVESQGTNDQLRAFEQQAAESGLTALRQSRRKQSVNMEAVLAETQGIMAELPEAQRQADIDAKLESLGLQAAGDFDSEVEAVNVEEEPMSADEPVNEMMSKQEFDAIIQQVITDTDSRITALEAKFAELLEVKESKFKDERKKVEEFKSLTVKEILTKK